MSQLLRALSRMRRPQGGRAGGSSGRDDDAVLAGLGVNAGPNRLRQGSGGQEGRHRPAILWVLIGVVLLAGGGAVAVNMWRKQATAIPPSQNAAAAARLTELPRATDQQLNPAPPMPEPAAPADAPPAAPEPEEDEPPAAAERRTAAAERGTPITASNPPRDRPADSTPPPAVPPAPVPAAATPPAAPAPEVDDFKLAVFYQQSGDFENALHHYRALLQREPLNAEAHNNLGLLYKQKRLYDDAIKEFRSALYVNPKYIVARNNLGVTLLEAGRPEQAATELRAIVEAEPQSADALVNLALALSAMKQPGNAQEMLMRAIGANPRHAAAHYNLARLYEDDREPAKALGHYRKFLEFAGAEHSAIVPEVSRRVAALEKDQIG